MAQALFLSNDYRWIGAQYKVLEALKANLGDKLAVDQDRFVISEGGFAQPFQRAYFDCLRGGYNRDAVVAHFEKLWTKVNEFVQRLRAQPDYLALPETKALAKQVWLIRKRADEVQNSYQDPLAVRDTTPAKMSQIFNRFSELSHSLSRELQMLENTIEEITFFMRPGQTVAQTVDLAKASFVSTCEKVKIVVLVFLAGFLFFFTVPLTLIKWCFWNSFEFGIKGKITTDNPTVWFLKNVFSLMDKIKEREENFYLYTSQLLGAPVVDEEHVDRFLELASHKWKGSIDLGWSSTQPNERQEANSISLEVLIKLITHLSEIPSCSEVVLPFNLVMSDLRPNVFPQSYQDYLAADRALQSVGFRREGDFKYVRA